MKIFNWVHRRFNSKAGYVKKNDDENAADDDQFPLEHWRGGILAIGTLGYDPLKDENQEIIYLCQEKEQHCEYYEDDDDVDESSEDSNEEEVESEDEEEGNPLVAAANYVTETEMEEMDWKHEYEYVMIKKKERTTLADLFCADPQDHDVITKKHPIDSIKSKSKFESKSNGNHNKLKPILKLNQMVRRILKRKIHPDVGPINSKVAVLNSKTRSTGDFASLLSAPDANI